MKALAAVVTLALATGCGEQLVDPLVQQAETSMRGEGQGALEAAWLGSASVVVELTDDDAVQQVSFQLNLTAGQRGLTTAVRAKPNEVSATNGFELAFDRSDDAQFAYASDGTLTVRGASAAQTTSYAVDSIQLRVAADGALEGSLTAVDEADLGQRPSTVHQRLTLNGVARVSCARVDDGVITSVPVTNAACARAFGR